MVNWTGGKTRRTVLKDATALAALGVGLAACGSDNEEEAPTVTRVSVDYPPLETATAVALAGGDEEGSEAAQSDGGEEASTDSAGSGAAAFTEPLIGMYDIYFDPAEITIPANTDVTIKFENFGAAEHNFYIDELEIATENYAPGQTGEIVVNAAPGEYEYYCSIPGHREAGMVGTLTVTEGGAGEAASDTEDSGSDDAAPDAASSGGPAESPLVGMYDIYFDPTEITIPANTDVVVKLENFGAAEHNFVVEELGIDSGNYAAGQTGEVVINAAAGEYEYVCTIPGHREAGMVGTLIVTEEAAGDDSAAGNDAAASTPDAGASAEATPAASPAASPVGVGGGEPLQTELMVGMYDIYFDPATIEIPANTDVVVKLENFGAAEHNFHVPDRGIESGNYAAGQTGEVVINAAAGQHEYVCTIPGHREAGMVGTLIITEGAASAAAPESAASPGATPEDEAEATPADVGGGEPLQTELMVGMYDIYFDPAVIEIPANTDVVVRLENFGAAEHNFAVEDIGVESGNYPSGQTGEVVINVGPGQYEFVCTVPGHREAGMVGALIVTDTGARGGSNEATPGAAASPVGSPVATPASTGPVAATDVSVGMYDIYFDPTEITIAADTDVTIRLESFGAAEHNFHVEELGVDSGNYASGQTGEIVINAPAGEYEYVCTIPGHREAGMVGTLTVI